MHKSVLPRVEKTITTKQAWDTLGTAYQGLDKVKTSKLQILRRYFESLSMKESKSMDSLYIRVVGLKNQLKYHGETIIDKRVVEKIFRSLPPRFESLVVTLEEHTNMTTFTIIELQYSLINHEHRLNRTQTSLEGAFSAQSFISRGRGKGRINFSGIGRNFSRGGHSSSPIDLASR